MNSSSELEGCELNLGLFCGTGTSLHVTGLSDCHCFEITYRNRNGRRCGVSQCPV